VLDNQWGFLLWLQAYLRRNRFSSMSRFRALRRTLRQAHCLSQFGYVNKCVEILLQKLARIGFQISPFVGS
jgi:hypothetical protein